MRVNETHIEILHGPRLLLGLASYRTSRPGRGTRESRGPDDWDHRAEPAGARRSQRQGVRARPRSQGSLLSTTICRFSIILLLFFFPFFGTGLPLCLPFSGGQRSSGRGSAFLKLAHCLRSPKQLLPIRRAPSRISEPRNVADRSSVSSRAHGDEEHGVYRQRAIECPGEWSYISLDPGRLTTHPARWSTALR